MILYNWDSAPKCNCGPNFISDLIGKSPIFSAASAASVFCSNVLQEFVKLYCVAVEYCSGALLEFVAAVCWIDPDTGRCALL